MFRDTRPNSLRRFIILLILNYFFYVDSDFKTCCFYLKMFFYYFAEVRPPSTKGQPVIVEFSIYVVDVNSINVEDMDFRYVVR